MAAFPKSDVHQAQSRLTLDEAASQLYEIVEGYFDEIELSPSERDERYTGAGKFLASKDAATSKA